LTGTTVQKTRQSKGVRRRTLASLQAFSGSA
jgi:hypothetical protein